MEENKNKRILFVTNFCPHYRIETFEIMSQKLNVEFIFFSEGKEKYWQSEHGVKKGNFKYRYLSGFYIGNTRITPFLPIILLFKKYDIIIKCINGKFALPITFLIAKIRKKPFILWTGVWMRIDTSLHKIIFPFTKFIYKHSSAIVVYGNHVKNYLISEGIESNKIFIAHHAVNNSDFNMEVSEEAKIAFREKLKIEKNKKIVLFLGRIEIEKGLNYLIDAFYELKREDTVLLIAGKGSEIKNLKKKVNEYQIEKNIIFTGYVNNRDAINYYSIAYVYVLPSITTKTFKEPWGLVVNEAFNQKLPVIVSSSVGAAAGNFVEDGVNGFIVPEKDYVAIKEAISKLLDDKELRNQMGDNAFEKVTKWDNNLMVQGFIKAVDFVKTL